MLSIWNMVKIYTVCSGVSVEMFGTMAFQSAVKASQR